MKQVLVSLFLLFSMSTLAENAPIADSRNQFGFDVYKKLAVGPSNVFFSPYSMEAVLRMVASGAKNETLKQIQDVLHQKNQEKIQTDSGFLIASRIWGQKDLSFAESFLKTAQLERVDFKKNPEAARKVINAWVEKQTQKRIMELLAAGSLSKDTVLVLTNAAYFKEDWANSFDPKKTQTKSFNLISGQQKDAPFMTREAQYDYSQNKDLHFLRLPYRGNEMAMEILLPKSRTKLEVLENELSTEVFNGLAKSALPKLINVEIPKFKLEASYSLKEALLALGVRDAFDSSTADFSGLITTRAGAAQLSISEVFHKAFIDVNEVGTEAAAGAAAAVTIGSAAPEAPLQFVVNKPFLFVVRHLKTNTVLFLGKCVSP